MRRVLLVRLSAMGDVVESLGAVSALVAARPDLECTMVVQRETAPLLDDLPGLQVVAHDRRPAVRGLLATARRLRARRFDVALDLQGNWKSAWIARLSGARERIGVARRWRREGASSLLLTHTVPPAPGGGERHPGRQALGVVRALAPDAGDRPPRLCSRSGETDREREEVQRLGLDPTRPFRVWVAADPADNRAVRPPAVERSLLDHPVPVVWLTGPAERAVPPPGGAAVLHHPPGSVRRLLALGAVVSAAGGDVVGPDLGATHVLAATGAPTAVLFGPQDPAATAPAGARVLRRPDPPPCMPCRSRRCSHPRGPVCMDVDAPAPR